MTLPLKYRNRVADAGRSPGSAWLFLCAAGVLATLAVGCDGTATQSPDLAGTVVKQLTSFVQDFAREALAAFLL